LPGSLSEQSHFSLFGIYAYVRSVRAALLIEPDGLIVRKPVRTYRLGWSEVDRFSDGGVDVGGGTWVWALKISLRDGRAIIATGTAQGSGQLGGTLVWCKN